MGRLSSLATDQAHARTIETSTFEVDETHLLGVGRFKDERMSPTVNLLGIRRGPGPFHEMTIRALVRMPDLVIEDIEAEIDTAPFDDCKTLNHSLDALRGVSIARGFTAKVKDASGGPAGCTHLVHLMVTMAPAILQGYWAILDRRESRAGSKEYAVSSARFLKDSCYAWRQGGRAYSLLEDVAKRR